MVSIIIPVYNEEGDIEKCLQSLSEQTYKDMEIIVVDDGSSDKTLGVLAHCKLKIVNFKLLQEKHQGAGAARNLGAKHAKGEILVFVDADMTFDKTFIANLVKPIEQGKTIGTFSKDEYLMNKENVWAGYWNINRGLPATKMHPENYPDTQRVFRAILKREFERAGGFNERAGYADDWTLSEKLGVEATAAPQAVFYHKNPGTLADVFIQSKWMAKRKYKLGPIGFLVALIRTSLPVSLVVGLVKSAAIFNFQFLIFKVVSDLGQFVGVLEFTILGKVSK